LPYLAQLEKEGIPTVLVDLEDQHNMVEEEALASGVPKIRYLPASRTLPGPEDVKEWIEPMLEMLTKPLTEEEKAEGMHTPPTERVIFEGTLDEAEKFYQQTKYIPRPVESEISIYTDGLPIVIPTEEKVKEMLKGTSHKPDEIIAYQADRPSRLRDEGKKGDPIRFQPRLFTATVEHVAVNAVMAGCRPEHLPVVLAVAESALPTGTTNFPTQMVVVSGPIVKEIGMNTGCGHLGPGSPVNGPIGRAFQLMARNLGGAIPGVNRMSSHGSPMNQGGFCIGENVGGLPPGWKGLNEEHGYKKDESVLVLMTIGNHGGILGHEFSPGGYRAFQKSGHGGMARKLGVKGIPGPHNWLEYVFPDIFSIIEGGLTLIMIPEMAQHLYEIGFKSKDEVYEWIYKKSFEPLSRYRHRSWPDLTTNGWLGIESLSGKHWKELPDDYMVPAVNAPFDNCIIIGGGEEEACIQLTGGRSGYGESASAAAYSVDAWR
jgi:hypothetical protein